MSIYRSIFELDPPVLNYSDDQPRADDGKWTDAGGGGGGKSKGGEGGRRSKEKSLSGVPEAIVKAESDQKLWKAKTETGHLVTKDGKYFKMDGGKTSLEIPKNVLGKMSGAVLTHNHPGGQFLSVPDVSVAINNDLQSIRAFGTDADGYRNTYVMERPSTGWPDQAEFEVDFEGVIASLSEQQVERYGDKVYDKKFAARLYRELAKDVAHDMKAIHGVEIKITQTKGRGKR